MRDRLPFIPGPRRCPREMPGAITFSLMQAIDPRAHRRTSQVLILMEGKSRDLAGHWNWPGSPPTNSSSSHTSAVTTFQEQFQEKLS